MLLGLLALAGAPVQRAETAMTMCDEGTHLETAGEDQGPVVEAFCAFDVDRIARGRDLGEHPKAIRLVASMATLGRTIHLALSRGGRLVSTRVQQIAFAQPGERRSMLIPDLHTGRLLQGLLQERSTVCSAARQHIRVAER